jgi:hypothetical protein
MYVSFLGTKSLPLQAVGGKSLKIQVFLGIGVEFGEQYERLEYE